MDALLPSGQCVDSIEDDVDVAGVGGEVEDRIEGGGVERCRNLGVRPGELLERLLLFPCAHREPLDELVGARTLEAALDEREQQPLAEEEPVARLEVATHPLRPNDEAVE